MKLNPDGSIDRFKARLVAKGYNQVVGEDVSYSFSQVAKVVSVRLFLAIYASKSWLVHQLRHQQCLGYIDEEMYMKSPEGYDKVLLGQVCKLVRSPYGLKQASSQ